MSTASNEKLVDLRIAHLNMIQSVIGRMAGFSASVKNFCVTICAAIIAVAFQKQIPMLTGAALTVVFIFGVMDTYYLALERRYRDLYERVAARPVQEAEQMSLNAEQLNWVAYFQAARSISVLGFYALLLIGTVALLVVANDALQFSSGTVISATG
jgi:hypothetical protein